MLRPHGKLKNYSLLHLEDYSNRPERNTQMYLAYRTYFPLIKCDVRGVLAPKNIFSYAKIHGRVRDDIYARVSSSFLGRGFCLANSRGRVDRREEKSLFLFLFPHGRQAKHV